MSVSERTCIAHLSDLHLPPPLPLPWREDVRLKQLLGYINWWRSRAAHNRAVLHAMIAALAAAKPDAIALSGDVIELGQAREFIEAASLLSELAAVAPLLLGPGNHDPYTVDAVSRMFAHWQNHLPPGNINNADPRDVYPHAMTHGPISLITLCSGVPTWLFSAEGEIGASQLRRLDVTLARLDRRETMPVIVVHHPPDRTGLSVLQRLRDGAALLDLLAHYQCPLILHGHTHSGLSRSLTWQGHDLILAGAPSASAAQAKGAAAAGFNLIDIERSDEGCFSIEIDRIRHGENGFSSFDKQRWKV